jgi:hypothetical protein
MRNHRCTAIQLDDANSPWQPLAKELVVTVEKGRLREKLATAWLQFPLEDYRQTLMAGFARRILRGAAVLAHLQLETPECGRRRQTQRDPAADRRR